MAYYLYRGWVDKPGHQLQVVGTEASYRDTSNQRAKIMDDATQRYHYIHCLTGRWLLKLPVIHQDDRQRGQKRPYTCTSTGTSIYNSRYIYRYVPIHPSCQVPMRQGWAEQRVTRVQSNP